MKNRYIQKHFLLFFCIIVISCKGEKDVGEGQATLTYQNPIIVSSTPDPTVIRLESGDFYLYSTEDIRNIPIYHSFDLVNWRFIGTAFTEATRPNFEPGGGLWAPDINLINEKYVLYYSMSIWGGEWTCGIGVATSDTPEGPFTDHGMLFRSNTIGVQNSIDPFFIEDGGKNYLFWGSFSGIYGIGLTDNGLSIDSESEKVQIAGTAYEGAYIHKRGAYYYLIASVGSCCVGISSTYTTVVGRSQALWGPYLTKSGRSMLSNNHETLIHKNANFVGVGHNAEIMEDAGGANWILYHGVSVKSPQGRCLLLDRIHWEDDWPYIENLSPSSTYTMPTF